MTGRTGALPLEAEDLVLKLLKTLLLLVNDVEQLLDKRAAIDRGNVWKEIGHIIYDARSGLHPALLRWFRLSYHPVDGVAWHLFAAVRQVGLRVSNETLAVLPSVS